ncbi:MAG: lamin tail domain-containing protein [Patescibacteria group bacterium]|nr:lamin tail domain-containing protein [Patescibacteria group bacterium]
MFKRRESPRFGVGKMPNGLTVGVFLLALIMGLGFLAANRAAADLADHVVINEVSIDSVVGSGGSDDDWVELYNPTDQAIDLTGWSLQKATSTGGVSVKVVLSKTIAAKGYFLVVRNSSATSQSLKDAADLLVSSSFSLADDNTLILADDNINITGAGDPNIVDYVGWGGVALYEGSPLAGGIPETKSIARIPAGEDTNQNSVDFQILDTPTPTNAAASDGNNIGGTVLLTITPDTAPAQNITSSGAQIVFQVNAAGSAYVKYGLDTVYASSTAPQAVTANATTTADVAGLACATTYHYAIYAANAGATEHDQTGDATFTTLPCGITLHSLTMTKSSARANNQYADGWQWEFNLTIWNMNETSLKMEFSQWTGASALNAGGNMRYSADNGETWKDIIANAAYPEAGVSLSGLDNDVAAAGRQVKILVSMKVPVGTAAGYYSSGYGILTE